MEFHIIPLLILFTLFLVYWMLRWKNNNPKPPQPSGSWPVIGHLHLLQGQLPHIALGKLADNYGPIFMIKLGLHKALVVNSADMAKECLGNNDKVFISRPQTMFVKHLAYNSAMIAFSPYGPHWRELRKITVLELLSNHRVEAFKNVRISEVRRAINAIYKSYCVERNVGKFRDMKLWFNEVNLNTTVRLIAGKSLKEFYQGEEYRKCQKVFREFIELAGAFVPTDALPFLRWFDIGGYKKAMNRVFNEIDNVAQVWLEEHKRIRRMSGKDNRNDRDFMDVMLDIFETGQQDKPSHFEPDIIIKATCMQMILAGADTTATTLTWALSLLLNNKDTLKKAQAELDSHVGRERQVNESDFKNLVYLQAILKETMRLYPAGPLSVPREAISDCIVSGYHIPAGTRLFVNLYKIHRDPQVWPEPLEFHPERFLTTHKDYDVRGQRFELMPFGSGRRICPGISFALQTMQFTLANLLHAFDISTPSDEEVDMIEGFGLSNLKALPLEVILIPRLSDDSLYDDKNTVVVIT